MTEVIHGTIYYQLLRRKDDGGWQHVRDGMRGTHPDSTQEEHQSCLSALQVKKAMLEQKNKDKGYVYVLRKTQMISTTETIE